LTEYSKTSRHYWSVFITLMIITVFGMEIIVREFIVKIPKIHVIPGVGIVPMDNSVEVWGVEGYGVTHYLSNGEIYTPFSTGLSVVVLGDSFTEATQVNDNQKFVSITEEILHQRGLSINLHNLGMSGRDIADYVYLANYIRTTYSPKVVVIQVSPSDFIDAFNSSRPNYFLFEINQLKLIHQDNYFHLDIQNIIRNFGLGSLFIYRFKNTLDDLRFGNKYNVNALNTSQTSTSMPKQSDSMKHQYVIMEIRALEKAYPDSQILFLVIPNLPEINGDSVLWFNLEDNWLVNELNMYSKGSVVYPVYNFQKLYESQNKFPRGFFNTIPNYGHLNSFGHDAVASALADKLESVIK
jgi:lysophospholipase L1-like esterase